MIVEMARRGSRVKHLAVWAADMPDTALFPGSGRNVPICGQRRVVGHWVATSSGEDERPLCSRCATKVKEMMGRLNEK